MYYYSVGYSSYDESDTVMLAHTKKFGPRQFERMAQEASVIAAQHMMDEKQAKARQTALKSPLHRAYFEIRERDDVPHGMKRYRESVRYWQCYQKVAAVLVEKFGFVRVEPTHSYEVFGNGDLLLEEDKRWKYQPHVKRLHKALREAIVIPDLNLPPLTEEEKAIIREARTEGRDLLQEILDMEQDEELEI